MAEKRGKWKRRMREKLRKDEKMRMPFEADAIECAHLAMKKLWYLSYFVIQNPTLMICSKCLPFFSVSCLQLNWRRQFSMAFSYFCTTSQYNSYTLNPLNLISSPFFSVRHFHKPNAVVSANILPAICFILMTKYETHTYYADSQLGWEIKQNFQHAHNREIHIVNII